MPNETYAASSGKVRDWTKMKERKQGRQFRKQALIPLSLQIG